MSYLQSHKHFIIIKMDACFDCKCVLNRYGIYIFTKGMQTRVCVYPHVYLL